MRATIDIEPPRQGEIEALLEMGAAFAQSLYPPESNFLLSVDELEQPGVNVYAARDERGSLLAMAALVPLQSDVAELKRMFVHPDARGQGLAAALLERIESDAASGGIREIVLETGPLHHAAIALYRRCGYSAIPQFGKYAGEEYSLCFAKRL